ncbi:hypothetical protein BGS1_07025 [Clostridium beijerinckii]|nr:hypothetical protein BGS1_07025 [Clostridium beijerinckii]
MISVSYHINIILNLDIYNETTGGLKLFVIGCIFIVDILLTGKQNDVKMVLLKGKQKNLLRKENLK